MNDMDVFLNVTEFGETVKIDGRDVVVVIDNDRLSQKIQKDYDGIAVGDILYYARSSDFPKKPRLRDVQHFNSNLCTVFDIKEDSGILEVILQRNEG